MRKFGLAAILEFVDKGATAGLGRVGRVAAAVKRQFKGVSDGLSRLGRGLGSLAMASVPVGLAFGYMVKQGGAFEDAMAKLRAVNLDTTGDITKSLEGLAFTLGAETKFSASQAVEGMTELSKAGLDTTKVAGAIRGTLAAAAAEGMNLSDAAAITASNMKMFKLEAKDAGMISGVLALASARTNATIASLQYGLVYAGTTARQLGYSLKDTVGALGALHDIGIKGSDAGTALRAALTKLTNPTKKTTVALRALGIAGNGLTDPNTGEMKALNQVFLDIGVALNKVKNPAKRVGLATDLLGVRAAKVSGAFQFTDEQLKEFIKTQQELQAETGTSALKMADIMLLSFPEQVKLMGSSLEVFNIQLFKMISGFAKGGIAKAITTLNDLSLALRVLSGEKLVDPGDIGRAKALSPVVLEVARGIKDGFAAAKSAVLSVLDSMKGLGRWLGIVGSEGARGTAAMITKFTLLLGAIGPVSLALLGVGKIVGGLTNTVYGLGKAFTSLFAVATRSIGGIFGALARRVPWLGKLAGGAGGILGKAGKFAENLAAQPVRVTNWAEARLGGPLAFPGAPLPGGAPGVPAAGGPIASILGKVLNFGTAIAAAGAAGYAFGRMLDRLFGISDKVAGSMWDLFGGAQRAASEARVALFKNQVAVTNAAKMAEQFAALAAAGKTVVGTEGGGSAALTRTFAEARIRTFLEKQSFTQDQIADVLAKVSTKLGNLPGLPAEAGPTKPPPRDAAVLSGGYLPVSPGDVLLDRASLAAAVASQHRGGLLGSLGAGALGGGDPGRTSPPPAPAAGGGTVRIEVPLSIDGREVARAVANVQLDRLERSGRLRAGERGELLSGRLVPAGGY